MSPVPRRHIAIAAGSTAGHVFPALAIAEAYRQIVDTVDVLFIGTGEGFETRLVPACAYRLELVQGGPLYGVGVPGYLRAAKRLLVGAVQARRLLKTHGTQVVIGLGSYTSAAALLAARSLGLLAVIHEPNVVPGLTNRVLGRLVDRVYLGFEQTRAAFPAGRSVVTGIPVRPAFAQLGAARRTAGHPAARPHRILVTGGSGGSPFLNQRAPDLLQRVAAQGVALEVRHQVGEGDMAAVRAAYQRAGIAACLCAFIDDMPAAYAWADFALTCAGAGTLAELAASGLPALLVPLSGAAADHQVANAAAFSAATGTCWVREDAWEPIGLAQRIAAWLRDATAQATESERVRRFATPDAARHVAIDCEALVAAGAARRPAVAGTP